MVMAYWAQLLKQEPLPPYVISSCGNCATSGSRLFWIISIADAACRQRAG